MQDNRWQFAGIFYGLTRQQSVHIDRALRGLLNMQLTEEGCRDLRRWISADNTSYHFILTIVAGEGLYVAMRGPFRGVKARFENGRVTPIDVEIMNYHMDYSIGEAVVEEADRFIIIGADNIWNVLGNQGVVDCVPLRATRKLLRLLLRRHCGLQLI
ncbi:hypothetical protein DCAR_0726928 [Daucus carota subsp. sativus]|uniref:Uncharacterized protein n=1 Tax=Daucus carota subsp. sativus TaxID=79200 RepID=A0A164SMK3_DAUCS|nr:hypothetical protein DCAR_0726928 [Daucus carota subsp. sativus]